ncbi:MAG TPA: hypothetical protein VGR35_22160 [Tepidisphaeraceae bacterium]|nr:hypothetical protein [Tepidisphaeraceae bacterium]
MQRPNKAIDHQIPGDEAPAWPAAFELPSFPETYTSRPAALVMTAVFLVLVALPGVYHFAYGLHASDLRRWGQWLRDEPPGDAMRKIETDFDQRFLLARVTRELAAGAPVPALRLSSPDTRVGPDGFVFYGVDAHVPTAAGFLDPRIERGTRAADAIIALDDQLRRRGIHLLVVPIPAKSSIYPDRLNPAYDISPGPDLNVDHVRWIERLRAGGADVLDLTDAFWAERYEGGESDGAPLYHPTDTHWAHSGTRLASKLIAERVRPYLQNAPRAPPFQTRLVPYVTRGDLRGLMAVAGDALLEPDIREQRRQVCNDEGVVRPGDEAPVLVLGDSYAELHVDQGTGLPNQLMADLGVAVQSAAKVGAKAEELTRPLIADPSLLEHKRVVVLAFTIRLLICCEWKLAEVAGDPRSPSDVHTTSP